MIQSVLHQRELSLAERLCQIHEQIRQNHPELCRIAIALYDAATDCLKTFAHSTRGNSPIHSYDSTLSHAPTLMEIARSNEERIIDDLSLLPQQKEHTQRLIDAGYLSSLTLPIHFNGHFYGFLFFNSREKGFFTETRHATIKAYAGVIAMLLIHELQMLKTFKGAIITARTFSKHRDEETGNHLERMSRYSHLIARELAPKYKKKDDWVEYIFQLTPLHDVGKVAIADEILLKPGQLTPLEFDIMKTHVEKGFEIINVMGKEFGLNSVTFFDMLRNIVLYHHEAIDGSGYPYGLKGNEIPLEARICTVADVFDALTSQRPYKNAWANDTAISYLKEQANIKLDRDCIEILIANMDRVLEIQKEFGEDFIG